MDSTEFHINGFHAHKCVRGWVIAIKMMIGRTQFLLQVDAFRNYHLNGRWIRFFTLGYFAPIFPTKKHYSNRFLMKLTSFDDDILIQWKITKAIHLNWAKARLGMSLAELSLDYTWFQVFRFAFGPTRRRFNHRSIASARWEMYVEAKRIQSPGTPLLRLLPLPPSMNYRGTKQFHWNFATVWTIW